VSHFYWRRIVGLWLADFADMRPIYGWQATTLWIVSAMGRVSLLKQLSLPSIRDRQMSSKSCIVHGLRRWRLMELF